MATSKKSKDDVKYRMLIRGAVALFVALIIVATFLLKNQSIYKIVALDIIIIWLAVFMGYFIWALYFYNFNFGISQNEWDKIQNAKELRRKGEAFNSHDIDDEPKYNPYKEQTFGLPGGTVRGMIAFSLLFGALALLIVSFDPDIYANQKSFFFDQFEFFKTAFLMMIAFYFGSRSLEYLRNKTENPIMQGENIPDSGNTESDQVQGVFVDENLAASADKIPQMNVNVEGNVSKIPVISPIKDPMSH